MRRVMPAHWLQNYLFKQTKFNPLLTAPALFPQPAWLLHICWIEKTGWWRGLKVKCVLWLPVGKRVCLCLSYMEQWPSLGPPFPSPWPLHNIYFHTPAQIFHSANTAVVPHVYHSVESVLLNAIPMVAQKAHRECKRHSVSQVTTEVGRFFFLLCKTNICFPITISVSEGT